MICCIFLQFDREKKSHVIGRLRLSPVNLVLNVTLPFILEYRHLFGSVCCIYGTFVDVGACMHVGTHTDAHIRIANKCPNFLSFFLHFLLELMTSEMPTFSLKRFEEPHVTGCRSPILALTKVNYRYYLLECIIQSFLKAQFCL